MSPLPGLLPWRLCLAPAPAVTAGAARRRDPGALAPVPRPLRWHLRGTAAGARSPGGRPARGPEAGGPRDGRPKPDTILPPTNRRASWRAELLSSAPTRLTESSSRHCTPPSGEVLQRPIESPQYTSLSFGHRCQQLGVRPSRGTVGDAYDNAMAESFLATLECERLDRRAHRTHAEARMALFQWLEGLYYPDLRRSGLGRRSPIGFECVWSQAA